MRWQPYYFLIFALVKAASPWRERLLGGSRRRFRERSQPPVYGRKILWVLGVEVEARPSGNVDYAVL